MLQLKKLRTKQEGDGIAVLISANERKRYGFSGRYRFSNASRKVRKIVMFRSPRRLGTATNGFGQNRSGAVDPA